MTARYPVEGRDADPRAPETGLSGRLPLVALAACLLVGCVVSGPAPVVYHDPATVIDEGYFYDELAPYGEWITLENYGRVWSPYGVYVGWRPYTVGRWVDTDECGWLWVSGWEWGWAPFHYGRWHLDSIHGWVWLPGTVWAPAWVAWRWGGGHIGWAPLPPAVTWSVRVGFDLGGASWDTVIPLSWWCFVEEGVVLAPRLRTHIIVAARNVTLVTATRNVTNYRTVRERIVNRSLDERRVREVTRTEIPRFRIVDRKSSGEVRRNRVSGTQVNSFRPRVTREARPTRAPPVARTAAPLPPAEIQRRQEADRRLLQDWELGRRAELERAQRRESSRPPRGTSAAELRRRHDAELRAQREIEKQQQSILNHHLERSSRGGVSRRAPYDRKFRAPSSRPAERSARPR